MGEGAAAAVGTEWPATAYEVGREKIREYAAALAIPAAIHRDHEAAHPERLRLPILLVQGERNYIFHPEGSLRTLRWLEASNDPRLYTRVVLPRYAHLDALMGRDASRDVFPLLSSHLDRFNA